MCLLYMSKPCIIHDLKGNICQNIAAIHVGMLQHVFIRCGCVEHYVQLCMDTRTNQFHHLTFCGAVSQGLRYIPAVSDQHRS
jgi:hypothetical protein